MGRTQHARQERTRGRAVCEATESQGLGDFLRAPLDMRAAVAVPSSFPLSLSLGERILRTLCALCAPEPATRRGMGPLSLRALHWDMNRSDSDRGRSPPA